MNNRPLIRIGNRNRTLIATRSCKGKTRSIASTVYEAKETARRNGARIFRTNRQFDAIRLFPIRRTVGIGFFQVVQAKRNG